ncbi:MAG: phosphoesterase [Bacteroidota bacterium]
MKKTTLLVIIASILVGCASYKTKYKDEPVKDDMVPLKSPQHSLIVLGNLEGQQGFDMGEILSAQEILKKDLNKNTSVLFLGNAFGPTPKKNGKTSKKFMKEQISNYEQLVNKNMEDVTFIPGKTEWSAGVDWIETLGKEVDEIFGKKSYLPKNGCPLATKQIGEYGVLISVDSQWFLNDWDKYPKMNDNCEIRDREKFFTEFESLVKKNTDKVLIVAVHHPVMSNGNKGGQYSLGQNLTPLPILGSLKTAASKMGGFSPDHLQNEMYRSFRKRLMTLSRFNEKVVFVSAHENNLQHIFQDDIHQVVSGSMVQSKPARLAQNGFFSSGAKGYAKIDFYGKGEVILHFYDDSGNPMYRRKIFKREESTQSQWVTKTLPKDTIASIYDPSDTQKSGFHKWFWGERYRNYYSTSVSVPVVDLDTLMGGITILRKGGGHQSKSLRIKSKDGREYVMRALEKSADAYLQAIVSKEEFIIGRIKGTAPEKILKDFYTGSHPYAPFVVGELADAIGIYHTNPMLCYIPKQKKLGDYNDEFGDKLFMIEERVTDGHGEEKSFGNANTILGTDDLVAKLASDEKYEVDLNMYVRARLFDMLMGDWDRHDDQWRWAEFKENGKVIYRPIPRDRDQVFSIMGDGFLMGFATRAIPSLQLMEGFAEEIRSVKGFNSSPKTFSLDMLLLPETTEKQWIEQALSIQNLIDEGTIDKALGQFPEEIRNDETTSWIKTALLARKKNLTETAKEYYRVINKISVVIGTDKDDYFKIEDIGEGKTQITGFRIKNKKKDDKFFDKIYDRSITKEIWIYGLDDKDQFEVVGGQKRGPKIRLIGGLNNDIYDISNRNKVFVYDYKSKKNTFKSKGGKKRLTDDYDINSYNPYNLKSDQGLLLPSIGFNPDEGIQLLATNTYTHNGFIKEPFTSRHSISAGFYFATSGYDISYQGDFARFIGKGALRLEASFTGPNFTSNFFGFGNETPNFDDDLDLDFNRVKIETIAFAPSVIWTGRQGSEFGIGTSFEWLTVEETENRFIETFYDNNPEIDNENSFLGVHSQYSYENLNSKSFPTLGLAFKIKSGYKWNVSNGDDDFGYVEPELSFHYPVVASGAVVFSSKLGGRINFGNDFQFFQGATLGAENGLRGYRFQRFTGKRSYYQSSDLKIIMGRVRTGVVPLYLGTYGGFDYGRVWVANDDSNVWNTSFGGGIFVNGAGVITLNAGLFNSDDGNRFNFGFSVGF